MWQINEVVKFDESHYRILFFQSGEIIWIHMEEAKGVPSLVLEEQLSQWIDEKRLFRSSDPFEHLKSLEPEPYRVCRRVNILRDYPDDKIKIYP